MGALPMPPVPYNPWAYYESPGGVRKFTNGALQSAIDDAIAAAGDAPFVVVAHHEYLQSGTIADNTTKLSALVRLGDGKFSLAAAVYKDWNSGDLGAEAKAIWKPF